MGVSARAASHVRRRIAPVADVNLLDRGCAGRSAIVLPQRLAPAASAAAGGPQSWLFAPEDPFMLRPSFRTSRLACLLLAIPLAALAILAWAQDKPRSGGSFTNSLKMKLVLIPAGKFTMGSPESEKGRSSNEEQHEV